MQKHRRAPKTPEQQREILDAWTKSGLTAVAYARQHDVHPSSLAKWAKKLSPKSNTPAKPKKHPPRFVPVVLNQPTDNDPTAVLCGRLEIELPAGHIVRLSGPISSTALAEFVRMLARVR